MGTDQTTADDPTLTYYSSGLGEYITVLAERFVPAADDDTYAYTTPAPALTWTRSDPDRGMGQVPA
jgi:hypothetical protein